MMIVIPDDEIEESFVRSSGPGGQNVNKVATAVRLRFDVRSSRALSDEVRERLIHIAGNRMTSGGVLVIRAQRYRTKERNRLDARERLLALVEKAAAPAPKRVKTAPSKAEQERRLEAKRLRALRKESRKPILPSD